MKIYNKLFYIKQKHVEVTITRTNIALDRIQSDECVLVDIDWDKSNEIRIQSLLVPTLEWCHPHVCTRMVSLLEKWFRFECLDNTWHTSPPCSLWIRCSSSQGSEMVCIRTYRLQYQPWDIIWCSSLGLHHHDLIYMDLIRVYAVHSFDCDLSQGLNFVQYCADMCTSSTNACP